MSTLAEIEQAADTLPPDQQYRLFEWLAERVRPRQGGGAALHSVLDIPPVSLGRTFGVPEAGEDLLGEMLDDRG